MWGGGENASKPESTQYSREPRKKGRMQPQELSPEKENEVGEGSWVQFVS